MRSEVTTYDLGVMTMKKIDGVLMREITDSKSRNKIAIFLCAVALRLFVENKVINSDMNEGNCFFDLKRNQFTLIDYGRTMTHWRVIQIINNLYRLLHSDIDQHSKPLIEERLIESQKLLYFFEKASLKKIENANDARQLIKVLTHIEERWNALTLGPPGFSCIGEIVIGFGPDPYNNIYTEYLILTQPTKILGSPLKPSTKVKVKDSEQEFHVSKDIADIADDEYYAILTESYHSRLKRGISSGEQARLSDERAYNAAEFAGTPYSDDYCHYSSSRSSVSEHEFKPEMGRRNLMYNSNGTVADDEEVDDEADYESDSGEVYMSPKRVLRKKTNRDLFETTEMSPPNKKRGGKTRQRKITKRRKTKRGFKKMQHTTRKYKTK